MKKPKKQKSEILKRMEYYGISAVIFITNLFPLRTARIFSNVLGDILYFASKKRRNIAITNLEHAFKDEKSPEEIRTIARHSCRSFIFTFLEIIKLRYIYKRPDALDILRGTTTNIDKLFEKAKEIHDRSGGCIFVTPHIGNWEVLPHASSVVGINLAVVARPLDNQYLEDLIYSNRVSTGQILIPKKNAMFVLKKTLQKGISIGMLPDQSTMKGIMIDFFGRPATTTPVPALLAVTHKRPVVVTACCRKENDFEFEGFVSDPIWPGEYTSEKDEIIRITKEITKNMEEIIRKYPEQYLWMHNRWKTYKGKKAILS